MDDLDRLQMAVNVMCNAIDKSTALWNEIMQQKMSGTKPSDDLNRRLRDADMAAEKAIEMHGRVLAEVIAFSSVDDTPKF